MVKKFFSVLAAFLLLIYTAGMTAFASSYDVDFSVKPQESSVKQGDSLVVNIVISTADQGYVDFEMQLEYNESVFSCESTYNEDGYVGSGKNGIYTLKYNDPGGSENPSPTNVGDIATVDVKFTVLQDAPVGDATFSASIKSCNGIDKLDLNAPVKLRLAKLYDKSVTITEGDGTQITVTSEDQSESGSDLAGTIDDQDSNGSGGVNLKLVIGIIIGGIIIFFSGCIVGYLMQQKKNESSGDGFYSSRGRARRDYYDGPSGDIDIGKSVPAAAAVSAAPVQTAQMQGSQQSYYNGNSQNASVSYNGQQSASFSQQPSYSGQSFSSPATSMIQNGQNRQQYAGGIQQGFAAQQQPQQNPNFAGGAPTAAMPQPQMQQRSFGTQQPFAGSNTSTAPRTVQPGQQQFASRPIANFGTGGSAPNVPSQPSYGVPLDRQMMEMAYRGEGTVGSYRPTPPAPHTPPTQAQQAGNGLRQNVVAQQSAAQPQFNQQAAAPQQAKQEYTIGRSGYTTASQQTQQPAAPLQSQGFSTTSPVQNGGSYLPQRNNGTPDGTGTPSQGAKPNGSAPFSNYRR